MNTRNIHQVRLIIFLAALTTFLAGRSFADSYTNTILPGYNFIANQLDHGSNTLDEIMPNVPEDSQLAKWDKASQSFVAADTFYAGNWYDSSFNPSTTTLSPGAGARLYNPAATYSLVFTGTPVTPVLPVSVDGNDALLSAQTPAVAGYSNIVGLAPVAGAQVKQWNPVTQTFSTNTFTTAWIPETPVLQIGESAFFRITIGLSPDKWKADNTLPLNQPASWTNNAVPGGTDFGVWNSIVTGPMTNELGADLTWGGIKILNPGGPIALDGSNTLILNGVSGIGLDMSSAAQNLIVNCPVTIASNQIWTIGGSQTLEVNKVILSAPVQVGGAGNKHLHEMDTLGVYPAEFSGASRTELGPGAINGALSLVQSGAGTLALTGMGNYSGDTTVSGGTLELQATASNTVVGVSSALGTNTATLTDGTTLKLLSDATVTFVGGDKPNLYGNVNIIVDSLTAGVSNQTVSLGALALVCSGVSNTVTLAGNTNGYTLDVGVFKTHGGPLVVETLGLDVHVAGISSNGVYPAEFNGASYGSPSEIEWNFGDGGNRCGTILGVESLKVGGTQPLTLTGANIYNGLTIVTNQGWLALTGDNTGMTGDTVVAGGATLVLVSKPGNTTSNLCVAAPSGPLRMESGSSLKLFCASNAVFVVGVPPSIAGNVSLSAAPLAGASSNLTVAFAPGGMDMTNATVTLTGSNNIQIVLGSMMMRNGPLNIVKAAGVRADIAGIRKNGVYPAEFSGASYGTPSEIEWNFGDQLRDNARLGASDGISEFTKNGNGELEVAGNWVIDGQIQVNNGALVVSSSLSGTGAVTVAAGAILGGNGSINGHVTVQPFATLSPGNGIGILTVNNQLTLAGRALMQINRTNPPNCDRVIGMTTVNYGGTLTVTNIGPPLQAGDSFKLFDAANYVGNFAAINPDTPGSGLVWDLSRLTVDGTISVNDITPPTLSCPSNLVVYADASQCQAMVIFPVSAIDNSDPAPVLTCIPPSGSVLPVGRTNVVCTATDASGNSNTCTFTVSVVPAVMEAAGETWVLRKSGGLFGCVASSAAGDKLVASVWGGDTSTSDDYGVTWIPRRTNDSISCIASSADGTKLALAPWGAPIPTSDDSGVTWIPHEVYTEWPVWNLWVAIASSDDGNKLVTIESTLYLYTSTNSGVTWTRRDSARAWQGVASSADGGKLLASVDTGKLYTSTNSGQTWTPHEADRQWRQVAMSADGLRMVAVVAGGQIYVSGNGGETWTACETNRNWKCVASSANGMKQMAGVTPGHLYRTSDGGTTWTECGPYGNWYSLACSASGQHWIAADYDGALYTSSASVTPLTNPPAILGATNQIVQASGPGGAVVTFNVTATNHCQPAVPVICTPPSGSTFPLGTNKVQCVAVDALGITNTATLEVVVLPASTMFAGLAHTPLGAATLEVVSNTLVVTNLGSGGLDGVAVALGNPWEPYGFVWQAGINYLGDASQHVGGMLRLSVEGTRSNSVLSVCRATYTNPTGDGIVSDYDFSDAFPNGPIIVKYWSHGVLVASDVITNSQVTLVFSDWPTTFGATLSGPYRIKRRIRPLANEEGPYGQSISNIVDAGIIGHPWRVQREGEWWEIDEVEIEAPTGAAVSDVIAKLQGGGGGINALTLTGETVSPASTTVDFSGLSHTSLGFATLEVVSNTLAVANLGTNGQDGVAIALGGKDGFDIHWKEIVTVPPPTEGDGLFFDVYGLVSGTNALVAQAQATQVGTNIHLSANFLLATNELVEVSLSLSNKLVATFTNVLDSLFGSTSKLPMDFHVKKIWKQITFHGRTWQIPIPVLHFTWKGWPVPVVVPGQITYQADQISVSPMNGMQGELTHLASLQLRGINLNPLTIDAESVTVNYAGLEHTSLGNASLSDGLVVGNIGSSGQDGVIVTMLDNVTGWGAVWEDLDPDGTLPAGAYLQEQIIGTGGSVTNGLLGTTTVIKVGDSNHVGSADFSMLGVSNVIVEVFSGTNLVVEITLPESWAGGGMFTNLFKSLKLPSDVHAELKFWPLPAKLQAKWTYRTNTSIEITNGAPVLGDSVVVTPVVATGMSSISAVQVLASQISSLTITNETVFPWLMRPAFSDGQLMLQWSGSGVLQSSTNLTVWTDVAGATSPYSVLTSGSGRGYYRVRQ